MKWVFFRFRRVREFVVVVEGRRIKQVGNLNEELGKILRLLGREYEKYHSWRGTCGMCGYRK
jgi:hypothetical protein